MNDLERMLRDDYRLITAEILYHLPDYPALLQSYTWQDLDHPPDFPVLYKFLNFWERSLDGKLHSVKIATCEVVRLGEWRSPGEYTIH